jgi:murein DD-endopeptidase MepM/ murein hydrolase activator NlpD
MDCNVPVKQGKVVAKSGDSGTNGKPPHLHFHIWGDHGDIDARTIPIERLVMKQVGVDSDFREYDARKGELDDKKVAWKSACKITEQSLENLKSEGVPDDVLEKLQSLKNRAFIGEKNFLDKLKETIGDEQTVRFKSSILKHARKSFESNNFPIE